MEQEARGIKATTLKQAQVSNLRPILKINPKSRLTGDWLQYTLDREVSAPGSNRGEREKDIYL